MQKKKKFLARKVHNTRNEVMLKKTLGIKLILFESTTHFAQTVYSYLLLRLLEAPRLLLYSVIVLRLQFLRSLNKWRVNKKCSQGTMWKIYMLN